MALVTQTPDNVEIATAVTDLPTPLAANATRAALNSRKSSLDTKAQRVQAFLEALQGALGNGALSGGAIAAGAGLAVTVAALKAFVGSVVEFDAGQNVGMNASATNYLWLRQDGTWTVNTTGVAPVDLAAHGQALLWGTATTDAGTVTVVNNTRAWFRGALAGSRLSKSVAGNTDVTLNLPEYQAWILEFTGLLTGNINVILPLTDGAEWTVRNKTTGAYTLTVKGATGTGVTVTQGRAVRVYCDGANIVPSGGESAA